VVHLKATRGSARKLAPEQFSEKGFADFVCKDTFLAVASDNGLRAVSAPREAIAEFWISQVNNLEHLAQRFGKRSQLHVFRLGALFAAQNAWILFPNLR
jgi:hypothetical protein